jgi:hypothetical protein
MYDAHTIIGVLLVALLVWFSLEFDKAYTPVLHNGARHPLARLLAGALVIYLSTMDPLLAVLALSVVFFWIADVNLLSSFNV